MPHEYVIVGVFSPIALEYFDTSLEQLLFWNSITCQCTYLLKVSAWLGSCMVIDRETPLAQTLLYRRDVNCQYNSNVSESVQMKGNL